MSASEQPLATVFARLWPHTIHLGAIDGKPTDNDLGTYCGMGTLVSANGPCILTAAHVWERLRGAPNGRARAGENEYFAVFWRSERLGRLLKIPYVTPRAWPTPAGGEWSEWGPDVALLGLSPLDAKDLENRDKSFFDLDRPRETDDTRTLWTPIGAPGEEVTALDFGAREK